MSGFFFFPPVRDVFMADGESDLAVDFTCEPAHALSFLQAAPPAMASASDSMNFCFCKSILNLDIKWRGPSFLYNVDLPQLNSWVLFTKSVKLNWKKVTKQI